MPATVKDSNHLWGCVEAPLQEQGHRWHAVRRAALENGGETFNRAQCLRGLGIYRVGAEVVAAEGLMNQRTSPSQPKMGPNYEFAERGIDAPG